MRKERESAAKFVWDHNLEVVDQVILLTRVESTLASPFARLGLTMDLKMDMLESRVVNFLKLPAKRGVP